MKNIIVIILFVFSNHINGQITVNPEVGISYMPLVLYGANTENTTNTLDPIFGLIVNLPINANLDFSTRISYANRENVRWQDLGFYIGELEAEYKHQDLNLDFSFLYKLEKLKLGLGPSVIRKFANLYSYSDSVEELNTIRATPDLLYGVNTRLSIPIRNVNINLMYIRLFNNPDFFYKVESSNRFDLTLLCTLRV